MPTRINTSPRFDREFKRLVRKYPRLSEEVQVLFDQLKVDERPGDKIPNVGYDVYKVRLQNRSAGRGKSGGFRAIYYIQVANQVILLTLYSKFYQQDISPDEIRRVIIDFLSSQVDKDDPAE